MVRGAELFLINKLELIKIDKKIRLLISRIFNLSRFKQKK